MKIKHCPLSLIQFKFQRKSKNMKLLRGHSHSDQMIIHFSVPKERGSRVNLENGFK